MLPRRSDRSLPEGDARANPRPANAPVRRAVPVRPGAPDQMGEVNTRGTQMFVSPSSPPLARRIALAVLVIATASANAADWYVSPKGTPQGAGTREAPWDIESALMGK